MRIKNENNSQDYSSYMHNIITSLCEALDTSYSWKSSSSCWISSHMLIIWTLLGWMDASSRNFAWLHVILHVVLLYIKWNPPLDLWQLELSATHVELLDKKKKPQQQPQTTLATSKAWCTDIFSML